MKMWRPDRQVVGPVPLSEQDITRLNRVFADAFTDRYRRDGLVGVRVPALNPDIWRYALRDARKGAMAWLDGEDLVAFNIAHHSGSEGWMGPLAVRPDRQGLGLGGAIVRSAIEWLVADGATTIGLETMPRTVDNIGFYSRLGFVPGHLTVTLGGDVIGRTPRDRAIRLSRLTPDERTGLLERCRTRLEQSAPGYDFTREHLLTEELGIGDTSVLEDDGTVRGFALWHAVPLADSRAADEVRVLKLFADSAETFERLVLAVEASASRLRIRRVAVRCQTRHARAYRWLISRGYRVRWTDLRMTLEGYGEAQLPDGEVLLSNWEI